MLIFLAWNHDVSGNLSRWRSCNNVKNLRYIVWHSLSGWSHFLPRHSKPHHYRWAWGEERGRRSEWNELLAPCIMLHSFSSAPLALTVIISWRNPKSITLTDLKSKPKGLHFCSEKKDPQNPYHTHSPFIYILWVGGRLCVLSEWKTEIFKIKKCLGGTCKSKSRISLTPNFLKAFFLASAAASPVYFSWRFCQLTLSFICKGRRKIKADWKISRSQKSRDFHSFSCLKDFLLRSLFFFSYCVILIFSCNVDNITQARHFSSFPSLRIICNLSHVDVVFMSLVYFSPFSVKFFALHVT